MVFEAFVVLYVGAGLRVKIEDDLGPYRTREHCEIRTEQIVREEIPPLLANVPVAIPHRIKQFCMRSYDDGESSKGYHPARNLRLPNQS